MKARKLKAALKAAGADALETLWVLFCIFAVFGGVLLVIAGLAYTATIHPLLTGLCVVIVMLLGFAIGAGVRAYKETP